MAHAATFGFFPMLAMFVTKAPQFPHLTKAERFLPPILASIFQ